MPFCSSLQRVLLFVALVTSITLTACTSNSETSDSDAADWVGTWATALQLTEPHNMPPEPGLSGNTIRQIVRVSVGGDSLRVSYSNEYGNGPLTINAASIARSVSGGSIDPDTQAGVTFGGEAGVTLAPGDDVVSDVIPFELRPLDTIALTLSFGEVPSDLTGHPGSRTTSYIETGDAIDVEDLSDAVLTDHWYVIGGIDVFPTEPAAAVVTLGNSITDGRGSGTNKQNRWPDVLAGRLQSNPETSNVGVLNMGTGGNCVLRPCLGPAAVDRFERDVIDRDGARWLIILHGVNDIGQASAENADSVAQSLIDAYSWMVDEASAAGIRTYGATILPFGDSFYDMPERETVRQTVNEWIRTSGRFDAVIDLDEALRDPENPSRLRAEADTGDHLHPNEQGHQLIGESIDLSLFAR